MNTKQTPLFLFLGDSDREGATSKLQAAGWEYKKRRLESSVENWHSIIDMIEYDDPIGILAKFTSRTYSVMAQTSHAGVLRILFALIKQRSHIVFIHESVFTGVEEKLDNNEESEEDMHIASSAAFFQPPPDDVRIAVNQLLDEYGLNTVVYKRNAEMTVMASSFVDQNERNLIFRIYVPVGRLWAKEAEKILHLFRDYLSRVSGLKVRQDQYATNQGVVYELFGDHSLDPNAVTDELAQFSSFMDLCVENPAEATRLLIDKQIDSKLVTDIVDRYSKEARRLQIDLRHDRERVMLSIRHRLESELVDAVGDKISLEELHRYVDSAVPELKKATTPLGLDSIKKHLGYTSNITLNYKPQIISDVRGIVAQEVSGTQHFGAEVGQLIELIQLFGGDQTTNLISAVYELEDPDAKHDNRLSAKQNIKSFLVKAGGKIGDVALGVLQSYIENKMGL